jgi:hypothetical protein
MDNVGNIKHAPNYFRIFHGIFIKPDDLSLIRKQASLLVKLSRNLQTWNKCKYADVITMASADTLTSLHDVWTQYAAEATSSDEVRTRFENVLRGDVTLQRRHAEHTTSDIAKSFSVLHRESVDVDTMAVTSF